MPTDSPDTIDLDIPGAQIAALAWGDPDDPPVLGLHGWLDNAATWSRVGPRLEGRRLVSIDFPGHGQSSHRPAGQMYHFIDWMPVIFDVADALGWEDFSILGHSMGAGAALMAAGARPERIEQLAVVDGLGPWSTPPERAPEQFAEGLGERDTLMEKSKRRMDDIETACRVLGEVYGMETGEVRPLVERGTESSGDGGVQFTYDLLLRASSLMRLTEPQVLAYLRGIESPTMLLRPEDGWPVDEEMAARRLEATEPLQLKEIEGGHHVHLTSPEKVAEVVGGFL
jgi:pimeloyl-ACP methyl ester carboxylesterase